MLINLASHHWASSFICPNFLCIMCAHLCLYLNSWQHLNVSMVLTCRTLETRITQCGLFRAASCTYLVCICVFFGSFLVLTADLSLVIITHHCLDVASSLSICERCLDCFQVLRITNSVVSICEKFCCGYKLSAPLGELRREAARRYDKSLLSFVRNWWSVCKVALNAFHRQWTRGRGYVLANICRHHRLGFWPSL